MIINLHTMVLEPHPAEESRSVPVMLLMQEVWSGALESATVPCTLVFPGQEAQGPHFEKQLLAAPVCFSFNARCTGDGMIYYFVGHWNETHTDICGMSSMAFSWRPIMK